MKRKGNPFEGHQQEKQERREALIAEYLAALQGSKVSFKHVSGLAVMVAKYIAEHEGKPCSKSTLLRNPRYKATLLSFLAKTHRKGTKSMKLRSLEDEQAKALVITSQLEAANLRREVLRLKTYVQFLEDNAQGRITPPEPNEELERAQAKGQAFEMKFVRTCQTLFKVLKEMEQVLTIDPEQRRILDRSRTRNNVVVDARLAEPFFEWLAANQGLAGGRR